MLQSLNKQIENITLRLDNNNNTNNNNVFDENKENEGEKGEKQVSYFLNEIVGMNEYYKLFVENGLNDMDIICTLTMNELEQIGIKKLGHRKKIKREIDNLNNLKLSEIFWKLYPQKKK